MALTDLSKDAKTLQKERANRILDSAKRHVHVLSGKTRDSLGITEVPDGVEVGSRLPRAIYEEFGTSKMSARPFMRPAIAEEELHRL